MRTFSVCTILVFCFSITVFGQRYNNSFYGEEKFKLLIRIPGKVLKILMQDKETQRCFVPNSRTEFSSNWFEATYINLNNDNLPDLLVKAKDENNCLNGNAISFWVFRKRGKSYNMVLYLYTIVIDISKRKSKKYYNISASRSTANTHFTTFYAFNGKKYVENGKKETPVY